MTSPDKPSRRLPHPGNVYASEAKNVAEVRTRYPHQFPSESSNYSWPDGWHHLVVEACRVMDLRDPGRYWRQIKEKDAGLRLYHAGRAAGSSSVTPEAATCMPRTAMDGPFAQAKFQSTLRVLEADSLHTCCRCGGLHGIGTSVLFNAWWLTVCPVCEPLVREHRALPQMSDEPTDRSTSR